MSKNIKIGIAGMGAIGSTVAKALLDGKIRNMSLYAVSEIKDIDIDVPNLSFEQLAQKSDIIIESLPPDQARDLARITLNHGKTLIMISSAALSRFPEIIELAENSDGRIIIPSGALSGMDGVQGLKSMGIQSARIMSTKQPLAYAGAPYITDNNIDLHAITQKTRLFSGNAEDAAKAFPANVNVAVTLSLAGIGTKETTVEVWADPDAKGNKHEVHADGEYTSLSSTVQNLPDPANPKTSMLAAHSIIRCLKQMTDKVAVI